MIYLKLKNKKAMQSLHKFRSRHRISSKNGVSPVVATSLLLVVAVSAVVFFQGWFNDFSSSVLVDVESDSQTTSSQIGVSDIIGSTLYVQGGDNLSINKIELNGVDCNFNGSLSGLSKVNISSCLENVSGKVNVVVFTDSGIYDSYEFIDSSSSQIALIPSVAETYFLSKFLGIAGSDYATSVVESSNGNFLIAGNMGPGAFISLLNSSGAEQWTSTVAGSEINTAIFLSDGSIITTGDNSKRLVKFSSLGVELWSKTLNESNVLRSVIEVSDGNIVLTGTAIFGTNRQIFISKFDTDGNEIWTKTIPEGASNGDHGIDVVETSDNGFIVTSQSLNYGPNPSGNFMVSKFDSSGVEQWSKAFNNTAVNSGEYGAYANVHPVNGDILISWFSEYDSSGVGLMVSKLNSLGIEQWTKRIDDSNYFYYGRPIVRLNDGNYIAFTQIGNNDVEIVKFDTSGNILWSKTFDSGVSNEYVYRAYATQDGGFALVGDSSGETYLLKLTGDGTCGSCSEISDNALTFENVVGSFVDLTINEENRNFNVIDYTQTETSQNYNTTIIFSN